MKKAAASNFVNLVTEYQKRLPSAIPDGMTWDQAIALGHTVATAEVYAGSLLRAGPGDHLIHHECVGTPLRISWWVRIEPSQGPFQALVVGSVKLFPAVTHFHPDWGRLSVYILQVASCELLPDKSVGKPSAPLQPGRH